MTTDMVERCLREELRKRLSTLTPEHIRQAVSRMSLYEAMMLDQTIKENSNAED
jgi:hypothetical protein